MGAPRLNRRKYEKPKDMWNSQRIASDRALIREYGLSNMKEVWKVQTELGKIRRNVRSLLSQKQQSTEGAIINRLVKLGILQPGANIDSLLDLDDRKFLERRLQSIVFRKGLAKSMLQARQLVTHGFIAINGKKVTIPGYMVSINEEAGVGYYKNININAGSSAAEHQVSDSAAQPNVPDGEGEAQPDAIKDSAGSAAA